MKYLRTKHLPGSPGFTDDDERLSSFDHFTGREVIWSEKLDGECTSMRTRVMHARSEESQHHPSQCWLKAFYASFAWKIPEYMQIVGESVYAKHSIFYDSLSTYFYVFAVIDLQKRVFRSIDDTLQICEDFNLEFVPILRRGTFDSEFVVPKKSVFGDRVEGYVVRAVEEFSVEEMKTSVAKWRYPLEANKHWKTQWVPNKLKK